MDILILGVELVIGSTCLDFLVGFTALNGTREGFLQIRNWMVAMPLFPDI